MNDDKSDMPADNGKRAKLDPDGEVKGSGVGAGGGQDGEDFDEDPQTGGGYQPAEGSGAKE